MKEGWQTRQLGEVLQKARTVDPQAAPDTQFEYIDVSSVSNATFQIEETQRLMGKRAPSRARRGVKTHDVLFATVRPTLKRIAIVPEHLDGQVCSTGYFVLRPSSELDYRFVFYYLFHDDFMGQMERLQKGASYPAVTDGEVRAQAISFPPLPEQHRIVAILDEAFEGIATARANAEKNLGNARAIFESYLDAIFTARGDGWVDARLGEVCSIARGGSPRPIKQFLTTDSGGINWIKISDATASGKYIYETRERIIPDGARRSRMVNDGDFLLSNSMSFGRPYIMRTSGCIHDGWLVLSEYAAHLNQDYLYYILGSPFVYRQFDRLAAGSTVRNLNIELASRVEIPIPSLERQQEVAAQLDAVFTRTQQLESIYQRKIVALDTLKQSLLHHAFSGQL